MNLLACPETFFILFKATASYRRKELEVDRNKFESQLCYL